MVGRWCVGGLGGVSLRAGGINVWAARRTILGGPPASSAARSLLPTSSALDRQRPHRMCKLGRWNVDPDQARMPVG
jgi:hypothetical protein